MPVESDPAGSAADAIRSAKSKPALKAPRVMVATDDADLATKLVHQLASDFDKLLASSEAARTVQDFQEFKPDVLVLAFDTLEKAMRYYLGLYQKGQSTHQHPHRTIVLSSREEVNAAFELCKKQLFDDYIQYWPDADDRPRVAMSIWNAYREMTATHADSLRAGALLVHARHLGDLEKTLLREFADGEHQLNTARGALQQVENEIAAGLDALSQRMTAGDSASWVKIKDTQRLAREIAQLKGEQLAQARRANSVEPLTHWALKFKSEIAVSLTGTRGLADKLRKIRPIVMVVDDDAMIQALIARCLGADAYELVSVGNGSEALRRLRHVRPDLILMDIGLPGLDGLSLTRRLKESPLLADIPIVMITGDARRETLIASREAGAAAFVVKPFTNESLMGKLEKFLPR